MHGSMTPYGRPRGVDVGVGGEPLPAEVDVAAPVRVLVATHFAMVSRGLAALLSASGEIEASAQPPSSTLSAAAAKLNPDLVLLEVVDDDDHLSQIAQLRRACPGVRVLIGALRGDLARQALRQGADGAVHPGETQAELVQAIVTVGREREPWVSSRLALAMLQHEDSPLSPREQQALAAVLKGQGTKEIAEEIHVSVGTVRNLLSSAIHKTGTNNRYLAAAAAQDRGWLQI